MVRRALGLVAAGAMVVGSQAPVASQEATSRAETGRAMASALPAVPSSGVAASPTPSPTGSVAPAPNRLSTGKAIAAPLSAPTPSASPKLAATATPVSAGATASQAVSPPAPTPAPSYPPVAPTAPAFVAPVATPGAATFTPTPVWAPPEPETPAPILGEQTPEPAIATPEPVAATPPSPTPSPTAPVADLPWLATPPPAPPPIVTGGTSTETPAAGLEGGTASGGTAGDSSAPAGYTSGYGGTVDLGGGITSGYPAGDITSAPAGPADGTGAPPATTGIAIGGSTTVAAATPAPSATPDARKASLWNTHVKPYLDQTLWTEKYAYEAAQFLMVPLHYAFRHGPADWQEQFFDHFERYTARPATSPLVAGRLDRYHYLYLTSRFLVVAGQTRPDRTPSAAILATLKQQVEDDWTTVPAWQWSRAPFPGGMRERTLWKLNTKTVSPSYLRVLIDEDMFLFALAADVRILEMRNLPRESWSPVISDILAVAKRAFTQEVVATADGGWLMQPGAWMDHADYAYAGQPAKVDGMAKAKVPGIGWDFSHSHRMPLWLTSLKDAAEGGDKDHYGGLLAGFETQLFNHVVVPPSAEFAGYRANNYMSGHNGVYRWGYSSVGVGEGWGPYELSNALFGGWWTFTESSRVHAMYNEMVGQFPFPSGVIDVYVGPRAVSARRNFTNGKSELSVRLSRDY